jgi:hypothetical protein
MSLEIVHISYSPAEAQLVRSRLEAAGFHPVVTDEIPSLTMEGYALAAGGVRVKVPESELEEAAEFLKFSV